MMQDTGEVRGLDALQGVSPGRPGRSRRWKASLPGRRRCWTPNRPPPRLEPERVDVLYAVEETITRLAGPLGERRITLRLAVPPSLPAIIADRQAVLDILYHLLNNAALASPDGSEVTLALSAQEGKLPVGDGREVEAPCLRSPWRTPARALDPEHHERVFERAAEISGLGDRVMACRVCGRSSRRTAAVSGWRASAARARRSTCGCRLSRSAWRIGVVKPSWVQQALAGLAILFVVTAALAGGLLMIGDDPLGAGSRGQPTPTPFRLPTLPPGGVAGVTPQTGVPDCDAQPDGRAERYAGANPDQRAAANLNASAF